jgi:hypothetical protein
MLLRQMQDLLGRLYDAQVNYDIYDFLLTDRRALRHLSEQPLKTDEQVLIEDREDGARLSVYIDETVLRRLAEHDPLTSLDERNLGDFCTALEGVSHFQYFAWSAKLGREVSLLELELQAEIDKYAAAIYLRMAQDSGRFPADLHAALFLNVGFLPELDAASLQRYQEANRYAARYCRNLDERYLRCKRRRPEAWLAELRRLYRIGHHEKVRRACN